MRIQKDRIEAEADNALPYKEQARIEQIRLSECPQGRAATWISRS